MRRNKSVFAEAVSNQSVSSKMETSDPLWSPFARGTAQNSPLGKRATENSPPCEGREVSDTSKSHCEEESKEFSPLRRGS
jgi:hypothetical protein